MAIEQEVIEQIIGAVKQDPQIKNHTHSAVVARVDDEGTVWVYVAGSDRETPTASTSAEVKQGDAVMVEWRNDRLYIAGNYSDPSAGAARVQAVEDAAAKAGAAAGRALTAASAAEESAAIANEAATQAVEDAATAATAAATADAKAVAAGTAAAAAQTSADNAATAASNAQTSANNANEYAARALGNLSTVQSVTETLNWITAHGTMTLTTDTELDPTHVYFVQDNNGDYEVGGVRYAVVTEPQLEDIGTYYELGIDESLNNYVGTHLVVTSEGLWLIPETTNGNRVLIATGSGSTYTTAGTYIIDGDGDVVARFTADGARIGRNTSSRLEIAPGSLTAYNEESVSFFDVDYDGSVQYEGEAAFTATFPNSIVENFLPSTPYTVTKNYDVSAVPSGSTFTFSWTDAFRIALEIATDIENRQTSSGITYRRKGTSFLQYRANVIVQFSKGTSSSHEEYIGLYNGSANWRIVFAVNYDGNDTLSLIVRVIIDGHEQYNRILIDSQTSTVTYRITTKAPSFVFGTNNSESKGAFSSTLGKGLLADHDNQTAIGKYNDNQQNNAFEVGNGSDDNNRSNAFEVDWSGNTKAAGDIEDGSGNVLSAVASAAAAAAQKVDMTTPEYNLDTTASAGTTDGDLYAAITALGWEREVID